jgi:hypothetical protein
MTTQTRPLIAVRLVGPADTVATQKDQLIAHFTRVFGPGITCRTSTRHASHADERRIYFTVTAKEVPPDDPACPLDRR